MSTDDLMTLVRCTPSPKIATRWSDYVALHLPGFQSALSSIPIPPGPGSISTAEAFWVFCLMSELQPSIVIESGSATGWSAFVIASAAPHADIHCFDPYRRPELLPPNAHHVSADWTTLKRRFPGGTVALFDDHVNQRRRVLQAKRAKITNVLFHDVYRNLSKSNVSLMFADLIGLAEYIHTFDPLWHVDPIFTDTSTNSQMYRWLTWLQLTDNSRFAPRAIIRTTAQRHLPRNPAASKQARKNWRAR